MLPTSTQSIALTETFIDVEKLLMQIVHKYAAKYRVPLEDVRSEAYAIFAHTYATFNPDAGCQLSSYLYRKLNWGLLTYMKRRFDRYLPTCEINEELCGIQNSSRFVVELKADLSEDANAVLDLLLHVPDDFSDLLRWNKPRDKDQLLQTVREHLRDMEWDWKRIIAAFAEIQICYCPQRKEGKSPAQILSEVGLTRDDCRRLLNSEITSDLKDLIS